MEICQESCTTEPCGVAASTLFGTTKAPSLGRCFWRFWVPSRDGSVTLTAVDLPTLMVDLDVIKGSLDEKLPSYEVLKMLRE